MRSLWENPIFLRSRQVEARLLGRGPWAWISRYGAALVLLLGPLSAYLFFGWRSVLGNPGLWAHATMDPILGFSAFLLLLYVISRTVNGTFSTICLEKEQKTYDSLLATLLTPREVVAGKLAAGAWPVVREILMVAPVGAALAGLAGCPWKALQFTLLALACAMLFGLLGLWASYTSPTSALAHRKASAIAAGLLLGGPLLDCLGQLLQGYSFSPIFTYLSPLAAGSAIWAGRLGWTITLLIYAGLAALVFRGLEALAQTARRG